MKVFYFPTLVLQVQGTNLRLAHHRQQAPWTAPNISLFVLWDYSLAALILAASIQALYLNLPMFIVV